MGISGRSSFLVVFCNYCGICGPKSSHWNYVRCLCRSEGKKTSIFIIFPSFCFFPSHYYPCSTWFFFTRMTQRAKMLSGFLTILWIFWGIQQKIAFLEDILELSNFEFWRIFTLDSCQCLKKRRRRWSLKFVWRFFLFGPSLFWKWSHTNESWECSLSPLLSLFFCISFF